MKILLYCTHANRTRRSEARALITSLLGQQDKKKTYRIILPTSPLEQPWSAFLHLPRCSRLPALLPSPAFATIPGSWMPEPSRSHAAS